MRKTMLGLVALTLIIAFSVLAADAPSKGLGTYVTAADIKDAIAKGDKTKNFDTQVREIDANDAYVGVAVVHRPKGEAPNALQHSNVIEIYYMLDGTAKMVTGGTLHDPKVSTTWSNIGPGNSSPTPDPAGSEVRTIGPGDVIFVPSGVTHYFGDGHGGSGVTTDITYLVYRIDINKKVPLK